MRYDSVPTANNMVPPQSILKPEEISLDLSSRKKIVIRPLLQRNALSSVQPSSKTLVVGTSIFSRKNQKRLEVDSDAPSPNTKATDPPEVIKKQLAMSSRSATPPKRSRMSDMARVEKLEKVKGAITQTMVEKRCRVVAPQKPISNIVPTVVVPDEGTSSQFSEEYARCGCTIDGRPPCQRCQFLRLTDRFCNLVNSQCEKWNTQK